MTNLSRKIHWAWLVIVILTGSNFVLLYQAGLLPSRGLLFTEIIFAIAICAVTFLLAYQHEGLHQQLSSYRLNELDHLTGLYTRHSIIERITAAVESARANKEHLSLLWIDIDHFQLFNERHGVESGDDALQNIAVIIQGNVRGHDTAARFGSDEFCVLLPSTSGIDAIAVAERLRMRISPPLPENTAGDSDLTVSIGVACLSKTITSADALMAKASQCLAEGVRLGGNQVAVDWEMVLDATAEIDPSRVAVRH